MAGKKSRKSMWMLRMEAAQVGQMRFSGEPCRDCGCRERYTSSGACCICSNERSRLRAKFLRSIAKATAKENAKMTAKMAVSA